MSLDEDISPSLSRRRQDEAFAAFRSRGLRPAGPPWAASLEVSRNCNFKCVMCPQSWQPKYARYRPEFDMNPGLFDRIVKEIFPGLEQVHFQGFGETLLSPHWPRFLERLTPYAGRMRFSILTNLSLGGESLLRRMLGLGFEVLVSCDGAREQSFDAVRGPGRWGLVRPQLSLLGRLAREMGAPKPGLVVTLQRTNYRDIPLFPDLAADMGAGSVTFNTVREEGPAKLALRLLSSRGARSLASLLHLGPRGLARLAAKRLRRPLSLGCAAAAELDELLAEARERAAQRGVRLIYTDRSLLTGPFPAPEDAAAEAAAALASRVAALGRCFKPFYYVTVSYAGEVGICCHLITDASAEPIGNLLRSPFAEIWSSPRAQGLRRELSAGRPAAEACRWCFRHREAD